MIIKLKKEYLYLKKKFKMSKSTTVIIIYVLGLVIGALFFDLWGAETSIKKGLIGIGWTALFLIFLFLAEKKED